MSLVSVQSAGLSLGGVELFHDLNLQIENKEKICLLGRNGTGKTSLMRCLAGHLDLDSGEIHLSQGCKISYFSQAIPDSLPGTAFEIIAAGLGEKGKALTSYRQTQALLDTDGQNAAFELEKIRQQIDRLDAWTSANDIGKVTASLRIDENSEYNNLSGGQKRRIILASALVSNPDLLLLDEPTNHLDIDTIAWLEDYLIRYPAAILFVTHDRMLLRSLANRILELDRGKLFDWTCNYDTFLSRKEEALAAEEKDHARFDQKLAQEEVWIRKGVRARRRRNEGRVKALYKLREERRKRRAKIGKVNLEISKAQKSGKDVISAENISFSYTDLPVLQNFSVEVSRGDKIGIVGPNGCGKTTLARLLIGDLTPDNGRVEAGTKLEIAYYDQMRAQLEDQKSIWENVCPNSDNLTINGKNIHIITYLQNFLFTPERAKSKVSILSGGERNRVMLAQLFAAPANLLVLDEPTNDLDIETLELLEELLIDFSGTVLIISHDRTFLNNVASSTIVFAENGEAREIVGGYDEWLKERATTQPVKQERTGKIKTDKPSSSKKKLSYKEKQELKKLPDIIESTEEKISKLQQKLADPEFYKSGLDIKETQLSLNELEVELLQQMSRWEELEHKNQTSF
jgi:ATP-binding cassette subfamily F protein uup